VIVGRIASKPVYLTLGHLAIALQTGVIAGVIATIGILAAKTNQRWKIAAILGLITGVVDFFVHPGMFGAAATEAIVTGVGAAVLSYLIGSLLAMFSTSKKKS